MLTQSQTDSVCRHLAKFPIQELDRDPAVEFSVLGKKDLAHTARTDSGDYFVVRNIFALFLHVNCWEL